MILWVSLTFKTFSLKKIIQQTSLGTVNKKKKKHIKCRDLPLKEIIHPKSLDYLSRGLLPEEQKKNIKKIIVKSCRKDESFLLLFWRSKVLRWKNTFVATIIMDEKLKECKLWNGKCWQNFLIQVTFQILASIATQVRRFFSKVMLGSV